MDDCQLAKLRGLGEKGRGVLSSLSPLTHVDGHGWVPTHQTWKLDHGTIDKRKPMQRKIETLVWFLSPTGVVDGSLTWNTLGSLPKSQVSGDFP